METNYEGYPISTEVLVDFFLDLTQASLEVSYLETYEIIYSILRDSRGKKMITSEEKLSSVMDWVADIGVYYIDGEDVRADIETFFTEIDNNKVINFRHYISVMVNHFQGLVAGEDLEEYDLSTMLNLYVKFTLNKNMKDKSLEILENVYDFVSREELERELEVAYQSAKKYLTMFPSKI